MPVYHTFRNISTKIFLSERMGTPCRGTHSSGVGEMGRAGRLRRPGGVRGVVCRFSFTSTGGVQAVDIALDKVFHLPAGPWELTGDELRFTAVNGWELALFHYVDRDGNGYWYTEFRQNGVNYRVTGKNIGELEYAALLEALLEEREDFAPGEVRTFRGTYGGGIGHQFLTTRNPDGSTAVEESWTGPLFLHLDDGGSSPPCVSS